MRCTRFVPTVLAVITLTLTLGAKSVIADPIPLANVTAELTGIPCFIFLHI